VRNKENTSKLKKVIPVKAKYREQEIEEFQGNPLIEALPRCLSEEAVIEVLSKYPRWIKTEVKLAPELRIQLPNRLKNYYQPLNNLFDLEQKISSVIRWSYVDCSPLMPEDAERLQAWYDALQEGVIRPNDIATGEMYASGFTMLGISGIGKSTAINRILSYYPQLIIHSFYKGHPLSLSQLTWLKLDCPADGSLRALCLKFFQLVDHILGTNYMREYAPAKKLTASSMLPAMGIIAYTHRLGVLIIDEIQNLSVAHSGGAEEMLNWFVSLVNEIGIPVVLIGTPKAEMVLNKEFRNARRGSGQGDVIWDRITDMEEWKLLIRGMWDYQWTITQVPYIDEFAETLYEESQGIVDIAIKLFMLSQVNAISAGGRELITPKLIQEVSKKCLKSVRPMLADLKSGDPERIARWPDIMPLNWDKQYNGYINRLKDRQKTRSKDPLCELIEEKRRMMRNRITFDLLQLDIKPEYAKAVAEEIVSVAGEQLDIGKAVEQAYKIALQLELAGQKGNGRKIMEEKEKERRKGFFEPDLRFYLCKAKKEKRPTYALLQEASVIKSPFKEFQLRRATTISGDLP
jgi:hypothetical protein